MNKFVGISLSTVLYVTNLCADELTLEQLMSQRTELHQTSTTGTTEEEMVMDIPASVLTITRQEIIRRGYLSIAEVFEDLPGFDVSVPNGTVYLQAYQRGYRTPWTQRTLLLIDGKVTNNLWSHTAVISRQIPMVIVERIEILYGPASALYGPNAFLGVVNIVTRTRSSEDESQIETGISWGSFNTKSVELYASTALTDDWDVILGLNKFSSDEPDISDYSEWGFTQRNWLNDSAIWGEAIGATINSPQGDLNLNGSIDPLELFAGRPMGSYFDPSENQGVHLLVERDNLRFGFIQWNVDEGYGPYYSFKDAQPNSYWQYFERQFSAEHRYTSPEFQLETLFVKRQSQVGGLWGESFGQWVSLSDWSADNDAWRIEQELFVQTTQTELSLSLGWKYEQKNLSRNYLICNYFDGGGYCPIDSIAQNSANGNSSDGSAVVDITDVGNTQSIPLPQILDDYSVLAGNRVKTRDLGFFVQGVYDLDNIRLILGLRTDDNNIYGRKTTPRLGINYQVSDSLMAKFVYGEAFQEPSAKDLYGGWNGRMSNSGLLPEVVANKELILVYQTKDWLHELSVFDSHYKNVIAGAQNVGARQIHGIDYRGRFRWSDNPITKRPITGYVYYSYLDATASQQYNNLTQLWEHRQAEQGDVAPHKIKLGLNIPLNNGWNVSLSTSWYDKRRLFSQNPLRFDSNPVRSFDTLAPDFLKTDAYIHTQWQKLTFGLKIDNLFKANYLVPGLESASSGDDFPSDADGFQNSLIPQLKERSFTLVARYSF